jgi:hypothetical protein
LPKEKTLKQEKSCCFLQRCSVYSVSFVLKNVPNKKNVRQKCKKTKTKKFIAKNAKNTKIKVVFCKNCPFILSISVGKHNTTLHIAKIGMLFHVVCVLHYLDNTTIRA